jgi:hypothetical protein
MRVTKEFHNMLTEFICTSLYTYNHAKNGGQALSAKEITDKSIAEFTGMQDYMSFQLTLPLLRNYTKSMVSIILQSIENVDPLQTVDGVQLDILDEVKEYLTAVIGGGMSRNNSEALAEELLDKLP